MWRVVAVGLLAQTSIVLSVPCTNLPASLLDCELPSNCTYGLATPASCTAPTTLSCEGSRSFVRVGHCLECHDLPSTSRTCTRCSDCISGGRRRCVVDCTAAEDDICLGERTFSLFAECSFRHDTVWSTAFALSVVAGGLGVDRFYLGQPGWAVFKILTFGGAGFWTFIDTVLIGVGYLKPEDGSLYID